MSLVAKQIQKSYGDLIVLDDIDLELKVGEIVGLLGRNGAGKSTLLKILAGINLPDHGSTELNSKEIGFLSERNPLYPHHYVREYLSWVCQIKKVRNAKDRIDWAIDKIGLEGALGKKINQLSKGYRQRLGLAATLLSDPKILILDEPINGLDPVQIKEYRALIVSLAQDKIIILSSHLMQEIEALCTRVLLLKDGKILEDRALKQDFNEGIAMISLTLNKPISISEILNINGISEVKEVSDCSYHVTYDKRFDPRIQIFDMIVQNELKIIEMTILKSSLSEIFD